MEAKVSKYQAFKHRKEMTYRYIVPRLALIDEKHAKDVVMCGEFVQVAFCKNCKAKHYAGNNRCRSRFCIDCSHRRSMIYVARMLGAITPFLEQGYIPHMLTLTVRDGESLEERLKFLSDSWRKMTHEDREGRRKYKERMKGGFRTIEVKIGAGSGLWHPHIHALFLSPPDEFEKDFEWIKRVWKRVTNDNGSVEVHKVKSRDGTGVLKAVCEVVKYCFAVDKETLGYMSDGKEDIRRFEELYFSLKGKRMFNTWGILRGIKESELEEEVACELEDEKKLTEFICQLCGGNEYEVRAVLYSTLEGELLLDI